jgi:hypothetical protein
MVGNPAKIGHNAKVSCFQGCHEPARLFRIGTICGLLQENRAASETFDEKTIWPNQHHQKTTS